MLIITKENNSYYEVKKSKFISNSYYIESLAEIKNIINKLRIDHSGACHVVHAAIVGENGAEFSYSDDGEPKGTSGRPTFEVLKGSNITNILVTTTRYYGGTLLGTGGLVSAYSNSIKELLLTQETKELIKTKTTTFIIDYSLIKPVTILCQEINAEFNFEYSEHVKITATIEKAKMEYFIHHIVNLTNGAITPSFY